jgi:hypothetical protein
VLEPLELSLLPALNLKHPSAAENNNLFVLDNGPLFSLLRLAVVPTASGISVVTYLASFC